MKCHFYAEEVLMLPARTIPCSVPKSSNGTFRCIQADTCAFAVVILAPHRLDINNGISGIYLKSIHKTILVYTAALL